MKDPVIHDTTSRLTIVDTPARAPEPPSVRGASAVVVVTLEPAVPAPDVPREPYDPMVGRVMPPLLVVDASPRVVHYDSPERTPLEIEALLARHSRSIFG